MDISDGNGVDTSLESSPGFSLSEPPAQGHVIRPSLDKGKSKMCVPEKLLVKRKQIINVQQNPPSFPTSPTTLVWNFVAQPSIFEAPSPTLVTKSAPL